MVKPETVIGEEVAVPVIVLGVEVAVYVTVPDPLPFHEGTVKTTEALALPAVAVPIVGAPGANPSEAAIPRIFIKRYLR